YLSLAYRLLYRQRDVARAQELLAKIVVDDLIDIAKPAHLRCQGLAAYLSGDFAVAERKIREATGLLQGIPAQPYNGANIAGNKAFLGCALARQGNIAEARRFLDEAREYLQAVKETEFLDEGDRLVGR